MLLIFAMFILKNHNNKCVVHVTGDVRETLGRQESERVNEGRDWVMFERRRDILERWGFQQMVQGGVSNDDPRVSYILDPSTLGTAASILSQIPEY